MFHSICLLIFKCFLSIYEPEMICRAWLPSATEIPAKLRDDRAGWVARCSRELSVTPVPSRLRVCRLDSSAKADTSLTWQNKMKRCHEKTIK